MAKPADIIQRRRFDFEVLADMQCPVFSSTAYASGDDLAAQRRAIRSADDAGPASSTWSSAFPR